MSYLLDEQQCRNLDVSTRREWLLPNGIGGYAMGTPSGINTRRYHGLLVAAMSPPTGRVLLLAAIDATLRTDTGSVGLSTNQYPGALYPEGYHYLRKFGVGRVACTTFRAADADIERRVAVHPGANAVTIEFVNIGNVHAQIALRPLCCLRDHHANFFEQPGYPQSLDVGEQSTALIHDGIGLYLSYPNGKATEIREWYYHFEHAREIERGLDPRDDLFCPCEILYDLDPGEGAVLVASTKAETEAIGTEETEADQGFKISSMLRDAAGKFFVTTAKRASIIAGYPWFSDWGRDTMISIPGLCLQTGRVEEARQILSDYSTQMYQGLIPNRFVEVGERADYNTADATLWFANAIYKTLRAVWQDNFAAQMREALDSVFEWHMRGTAFGIGVDPADGLLSQGGPGLQLTWMDAKIGDWVVTPRTGKAIEINGLWINALRIMAWLAERSPGPTPASTFSEAAEKAAAAFESTFWDDERGYYIDVADPVDPALRPNQVIAMALPFSPVDPEHAKLALTAVTRELLTPDGLRTLAPNEPGYRGEYRGPLQQLDAAYHEGTAWPWLLGSFASALARYTGDTIEAKRILRNAREMLCESGLGGISEVYDGNVPQQPGGCPWQAWSVAEILRAWCEDLKGD